MQINYNFQNIELRFWAWCTERHITDNGFYINQNVTGDILFIPMLKNNSVILEKILTAGLNAEQLIEKLNSFGLRGEDYYILFMQKGIIE